MQSGRSEVCEIAFGLFHEATYQNDINVINKKNLLETGSCIDSVIFQSTHLMNNHTTHQSHLIHVIFLSRLHKIRKEVEESEKTDNGEMHNNHCAAVTV